MILSTTCKTVSTHTMEYIDAATPGTLSPHVLPVCVTTHHWHLNHQHYTCQSHLKILCTSTDTYTLTILIENKQFATNWHTYSGKIKTDYNQPDHHSWHPTWKLFSMLWYSTKYIGVTKDATMAVELSPTQFQACQEANGQFCIITTSFQPLANLPSCKMALYAKEHSGHSIQMLIADMQGPSY